MINPTKKEEKRIQIDPWFCKVYQNQGYKATVESGFVVDNLEKKDLGKIWNQIADPITPFNQIIRAQKQAKRSQDRRKQVVLFASGGFSPVHRGHFEMFFQARKKLIEDGFNPVGGFFIPDHDTYLKDKLKRKNLSEQELIPAEQRIRLLNLAILSLNAQNWLAVDAFAALHVDVALNYPEVGKRLANYLNHFLIDSVELCYLFGEDNQGFQKAFQENNQLYFCLPRSNPKENNFSFVSSTEIRNGKEAGKIKLKEKEFKQAPKDLLQYIATNKNVRRIEKPETKSKYILRNDLAKSSRTIRSLLPKKNKFQACSEEFAFELKKLLQKHLSQEDLSVEIFQEETQKKLLENFQKHHQIILLDTFVPDPKANKTGIWQFEQSRAFDYSDSQFFGKQLIARPESNQSLESQASKIPSGEYLLLDDDIVSGYTVSKTKQILNQENENIQITAVSSFLDDLKEDLFDVVDAKDFLFGADYGGLVVEFFSYKSNQFEYARVPYLFPFVDLASRASIFSLKNQKEFSKAVLQLNIDFYDSLNQGETLLQDLPKPSFLFWENFYPEIKTINKLFLLLQKTIEPFG